MPWNFSVILRHETPIRQNNDAGHDDFHVQHLCLCESANRLVINSACMGVWAKITRVLFRFHFKLIYAVCDRCQTPQPYSVSCAKHVCCSEGRTEVHRRSVWQTEY